MRVALLVLAAQTLWAQTSGRFAGVVTDAATRLPLGYARVTASNAAGDAMSDVTAADGSFRLDDLPAGELTLRVERPDYRGTEARVSIAGGELVRHSFEIHSMARIKGRVVDQESDEPLPDRKVFLKRGGANSRPFTAGQLGEQGDFEFAGLKPGDYTLELDPLNEGQVAWALFREPYPKKYYGAARYPLTIHIEEGEQRFIDWRVSATKAYTVTCSIEAPAAYENLPVLIWHDDVNVPMDGKKATGTFRLEGMLPGMHTISVVAGEKSGRAYGSVTVNVTDHDVDEMTIRPAPGVNVTGSFRILEEDVPPPERKSWAGLMPVGMHPGTMNEALNGSWTELRAEGIAPGEYWPDMSTLPGGFTLIDVLLNGVSAGGRPINLNGAADLTFVVTSKPGTIAGTVRDKNQVPLKGAELVLIPEYSANPTLIRQTQSGVGGAFAFPDLVPGKYRIEGGVEVEVRTGEMARVDLVR